jgi:hypothetical protein
MSGFRRSAAKEKEGGETALGLAGEKVLFPGPGTRKFLFDMISLEPEKMPLPLNLIKNFHNRLSKFIQWGESKGIRFEGSRVLKYIELLSSYRAALEANEIEDLINSRGAAYLDQIHLEVAELIQLYESLRDFDDSRLKSRFQSIVRGPELLQDDVTGDSRDTQFELVIAALLFRVKINKLQLHSRHDVVCYLHHNPLIIECKRPRKSRTLRDAYAKGAHQIETSDLVATNPKSKGVVALDLTQTVVPALTGSQYPSLEEMEKAFVRQFTKAWIGLQITISDYSDRVSAVHLYCQAPWYLANASFLPSVPSQHNLIVINPKDYQRNQKIANTYADFLKRISNTSFLR